MAYGQGDIVLIEDPYKDGKRPVLIVSNDERPYQGKQYTLAVISTTERAAAVELDESDIERGQILSYPSYVNVWSLHEVEHVDIDRRVARISQQKRREVAQRIHHFVDPT